MVTRLFWLIMGAFIAFWVFKNDPELTFLIAFREWLLDILQEFQKDPETTVSSLVSKYL